MTEQFRKFLIVLFLVLACFDFVLLPTISLLSNRILLGVMGGMYIGLALYLLSLKKT